MNQKEYELIARVFQSHRKRYGGRTDSVTLELIEDMADELEVEYKNFNRPKFIGTAKYGYDDEYQPLCPKYGEKVLPDENGKCSLCGKHFAW